MKIIVVGSSNTDMIIKVPRIPKPGETILGGIFQTAAGGKGANQAVAAARAANGSSMLEYGRGTSSENGNSVETGMWECSETQYASKPRASAAAATSAGPAL